MAIAPDRVYPPRRGLGDEQLDFLAGLLDDMFRVPGTGIRFGLDSVIGLIPGLGDLLTGLASFVIVFAAWQRGAPRVTVARMVLNIGIDTVLGSVPILGDAFDVAWKSNRRNYQLLTRIEGQRSRQTWRDWLFVLGIAVAVAAIVVAPIALVIWLIHLRG
jgi:Domain of unknown function (DUF4112)